MKKPKGKSKGQKGKNNTHVLPIGQKGQGKQKTKFKSKKGQKGKGYTAEEASLPET